MKRFFRNMLGDDYRWYALAFSIVFAVFSAVSVCIFYHMRNFASVTAYYTSKTASMARDIFFNVKISLVFVTNSGVYWNSVSLLHE